jgi:hypothetical protein
MKTGISPSMKSPLLIRLKNIPIHWRLRWLVVLLMVSSLALMTGYWAYLENSNAELKQDTLALADQQAGQLADAVARQADDLILGIDTGLRHMRHDYLNDPKSFQESVRATIEGYPEDVILNVSVFDATGEAIYNMAPASGRVVSSDREFFRAQAESSIDHLHVSQAILGRVSKVWTIPLSRKVMRHGRFAGVIVVFVRADYGARVLARISRH